MNEQGNVAITHQLTRLFWLFLGLSFLARAAAAPAVVAPTRLAILSDDVSAAPLVDLLTVEISRVPGVQLLERGEIERVYKEQWVSANNQDFLKLGRIMGAQGLLLLSARQEGGGGLLELKFIAVSSGVVLCTERFHLGTDGANEWVTGFARQLALLIPKASVPVKEAIPVSVVGLRSGVQSPEGRELEAQLTALLVEQLSRRREVFVLERQTMDVLAGEKELAGMEESGFWNGCYLLEGTIDRDGYSPQTLTINARLMPPGQGVTQELEARGSRTNLMEGIAALADKICSAFKLGPNPTPWDSAREARQFATNATWACRWGLLGQAQAASESAWALGDHRESLALLRVRAYADDVWPLDQGSGNIQVPGLPDVAKLRPLLRALTCYCRDAPFYSTNAPGINEAWYVPGLRLLRESTAMLDGFYHWAELTAAHEEQVAEVRRLTRKLNVLLEAYPPVDDATLQQWYRKGTRDAATLSSHLRMVELAKWNEGGLWFDRPEDSLPMFRAMLAQGYSPSDLPRIVGWTWEQKQAVPGIMRRFIDELCASTNPPVRLGGLILALEKTPFYPETEFHARESALVGALWDLRQWVIESTAHAAVLGSVEDVLRKKYDDTDWNGPFSHEPFAGTRFRLEREFLCAGTDFDSSRFQAIFPSRYDRVPPAEARELALAMNGLTNRFAVRIRDGFRARAGLAVTAQPAPPLPSIPAEEVLTARFVPWKVGSLRAGPQRRVYFERLIVRGGRLWAMVGFPRAGEGGFGFHPPTSCVSIDPQSGLGDEWVVPENMGPPGDRVEVTDEAFYVTAENRLLRFRFSTRTWESGPLPLEGGAVLTALGGRLYLANADVLLEVDPGSFTARVLASARRQPSLNLLDELLDRSIRIYPRADGTLGLIVARHFLGLTPATGEITENPMALPLAFRWFETPLIGSEVVLLRAGNGILGMQVAACWNDHPSAELILRDFRDVSGVAVSSPATGKTRWEWPPAFDLEASSILPQGTALWVLSPRKVWQSPGIRFYETARYADARQATLLRFEATSPSPRSVPIAFEKAPIEPFEPFSGGYAFLRMSSDQRGELPFWLDTPAGLVFSAPTLGGHWLIPKDELESRLSAESKMKSQHALVIPGDLSRPRE